MPSPAVDQPTSPTEDPTPPPQTTDSSLPTAAEEAVQRARAIAARLSGESVVTGGPPSMPSTHSTDTAPVSLTAESALAAAFGDSSSGGDAASSKRKRWGLDTSTDPSTPSNPNTDSGANAAADAVAAAIAAAKRSKINPTENSSKKIWIPSDSNPGYNYVGLLIGPGGSKQKELVERAGGSVKISVRGRGSSGNAPVPGMPEEPLHVLLEGDPGCVSTAEVLINELLQDTEESRAEKARQLSVVQESNGTGNAAAATTTSYQPKPVAQIIGLNQPGGGGGSHYGPGGGDNQSADPNSALANIGVGVGGAIIEEKIGVPNGVVGYIIGRGGESITDMQRRTDCRVQIQKEHEMDPGSTQRVITLTAANRENLHACRTIIEEMVRERLRLNEQNRPGAGGGMGVGVGVGAGPAGGGGPMGTGPGANAAAQAAQLQQALSERQAHVQFPVPNADVGLVIGRGGMTIRSLQERSGANIQIPQGPDANDPTIRTVNITHPNREGADFAKTLIEELLKGKLSNQQGAGGQGGGGHYGHAASTTDVTLQINIPDKDVGMCIGRSGCVIREMQQKTKSRIQIPSHPTPGSDYRQASVTGPADGCNLVQQIIARISAEQSSQFVMTGEVWGQLGGGAPAANPYGYGAQQQQQTMAGTQQRAYGGAAGGAAGGQSDYSAQWAAYYASQGAGAVASAATAATGMPAAAAHSVPAAASTVVADTSAAQPAADAYYDAFHRYAYHYGESAARTFYKDWSPPVGTTNPYGANPALADAADATAAAAAAPNPVSNNTEALDLSSHQGVKDTSARRLSNLPAWMTKGQ